MLIQEIRKILNTSPTSTPGAFSSFSCFLGIFVDLFFSLSLPTNKFAINLSPI